MCLHSQPSQFSPTSSNPLHIFSHTGVHPCMVDLKCKMVEAMQIQQEITVEKSELAPMTLKPCLKVRNNLEMLCSTSTNPIMQTYPSTSTITEGMDSVTLKPRVKWAVPLSRFKTIPLGTPSPEPNYSTCSPNFQLNLEPPPTCHSPPPPLTNHIHGFQASPPVKPTAHEACYHPSLTIGGWLGSKALQPNKVVLFRSTERVTAPSTSSSEDLILNINLRHLGFVHGPPPAKVDVTLSIHPGRFEEDRDLQGMGEEVDSCNHISTDPDTSEVRNPRSTASFKPKNILSRTQHPRSNQTTPRTYSRSELTRLSPRSRSCKGRRKIEQKRRDVVVRKDGLLVRKRGKAVTLATATQWASDLNTYQYLRKTHKTDAATAARLNCLLDRIDVRKEGVPEKVLNETRLAMKLRPFVHQTVFGVDVKRKAKIILDCWARQFCGKPLSSRGSGGIRVQN
jgi:hypothetical protein